MFLTCHDPIADGLTGRFGRVVLLPTKPLKILLAAASLLEKLYIEQIKDYKHCNRVCYSEYLLSEEGPVVCILSGGLDSVCTAAYMAKEKKYQTYMITFMYGQRAMTREVRQAKRFAKLLTALEHQVIDVRFMKRLYGKTNSLTNTAISLAKSFDYTIVVPVRNAIFITIAAAWAMSIKAKMIAYGAHSDDVNYPDCRPNFIKSIANVLNLAEEDGIRLGLSEKITIWSPVLAGINKTDLLKIGYRLLGDEIFRSWSCYSGGLVGKRGYVLQCGICESCINRKVAINKAGIKDKTHYANNCEQGTT